MNNFARTLAVELAEVTFVVALPCFMHIHKTLPMFANGQTYQRRGNHSTRNHGACLPHYAA